MSLARPEIAKKDFPLSRRGYDPEAVDAHLSELANRIEGERPEPASLASLAGEQVQTIVAAAESSASQIRSEAESEARATREAAARDAEQTRAEAKRQAEEHIARVREAAERMLGRIGPLQTELESVLGGVRASGERLGGELADLRLEVDDLSGSGGPPVPASSTPDAIGALGSAPPAPPNPPAAYRPASSGTLGEEETVRLTALDMALAGTPREETDRWLATQPAVGQREQLLDSIYEKAEKKV